MRLREHFIKKNMYPKTQGETFKNKNKKMQKISKII